MTQNKNKKLDIADQFMCNLWFKTRLQPPQYVIQAYILGPKNVNLQETGPQYLKFEEALGYYEDTKRNPR